MAKPELKDDQFVVCADMGEGLKVHSYADTSAASEQVLSDLSDQEGFVAGFVTDSHFVAMAG